MHRTTYLGSLGVEIIIAYDLNVEPTTEGSGEGCETGEFVREAEGTLKR